MLLWALLMEKLKISMIRKIFSLQYPMFVLVLFELPTFCLHSFIRNWVVLNKEDDESFFSLPLLLCFGEINIDRMYNHFPFWRSETLCPLLINFLCLSSNLCTITESAPSKRIKLVSIQFLQNYIFSFSLLFQS